MTRVAIVAPTPMMRAGLRAMLATDEVQVVGEAASLDEALSEVPDADVLVAAGAELLEGGGRVLVGESAPAMVVLSDDDRPLAALRALPLRGWGIVSPDASAAELQAAVTAAAQGMTVLPLALSRRLLGPHPGLQTVNDGPLDEPLTGRELEVLALISQGLSNKLIARSLQISEHTVKFHVSSIYTKLGASSRTEAVSRGARHGLVSL